MYLYDLSCACLALGIAEGSIAAHLAKSMALSSICWAPFQWWSALGAGPTGLWIGSLGGVTSFRKYYGSYLISMVVCTGRCVGNEASVST